MLRKSKVPGLQTPSAATGDARAFFEAVRERLQLLGGERGDPDAAAVTRGELRALREALAEVVEATDSGATQVELDPTSFDFGQFSVITLTNARPNTHLLVQSIQPEEKWRIPVSDLLSLFARRDSEVTLNLPWVFAAEDYGFDVSGAAPRIRFIEEPLGDGVEDTLPGDSAIWDWYIDSGVLSLRVRNDADTDGMRVFEVTRTAANADSFDVLADALMHNGEQVITQAGLGLEKNGDELAVVPYSTHEVNIGALPRYSGSFDITGLTDLVANTPVLIWQAADAYTDKGTLRDEAEMDQVIATGYVLNTTTIRVHWVALPSGPIVGNVKFNYWVGT